MNEYLVFSGIIFLSIEIAVYALPNLFIDYMKASCAYFCNLSFFSSILNANVCINESIGRLSRNIFFYYFVDVWTWLNDCTCDKTSSDTRMWISKKFSVELGGMNCQIIDFSFSRTVNVDVGLLSLWFQLPLFSAHVLW